MTEWQRPISLISPDDTRSRDSSANRLWRTLGRYIEEVVLPLEAGRDADTYLQTEVRSERFPLLSDDMTRFVNNVQTQALVGMFGSDAANVGPVECDLLAYASSQSTRLLALVGGMGCGKTTTLQYVRTHFLQNCTSVIYLDFDQYLDGILHPEGHRERRDAPVHQDGALRNLKELTDERISTYLAKIISQKFDHLLDPGENLRNAWDWACSEDFSIDEHPASIALADAIDELRTEFEHDWRDAGPAQIKLRKQLYRDIKNGPARERLQYQFFLIDYYLTVKCGGDRTKLVVVFDNLDPLPPKTQRLLARAAIRMSRLARCKFILSLRPLTYARTLQAASSIVEIVEHLGPPITHLMLARLERLARMDDASLLSEIIGFYAQHQTVDGSDQKAPDVQPQDIGLVRSFAGRLAGAIREERRGVPGDPSLQTFLEGASGYSLRNGLILGHKLFRSNAYGDDRIASGALQLRPHDTIKAMLCMGKFYQSSPRRVVANVFKLPPEADLGQGHLLAAVRLLAFLEGGSAEDSRTVDQILSYLSSFGYSEGTIVGAMNLLISQYKRLAWSDTVVAFDSNYGDNGGAGLPGSSRVYLAPAGRFYLQQAIYNLEYVQEVHYDSYVPLEQTYQHNPDHFDERMEHLLGWVKYLHDVDTRETWQHIMDSRSTAAYTNVFGRKLISLEMMRSLGRQVWTVSRAIARSLDKNRRSHELKERVLDIGRRWSNCAGVAEYQLMKPGGLLERIRQTHGR